MKKRILTLLAIVVLLVTVSVFSVGVNATEATCAHCNKAMSQITWEPWTVASGDLNTTGHYQLTGDYNQTGQVKLTGGDVVIDLAGHTLTTSTGRPFYVNGGTLSLLDSSVGKTALVKGKATASGAVLFVNTNGTLHIYGGTYESAATTGKDGGTISISGNVTLHDGVIKGSTSTTAGGCLQLTKGSFTMIGGTLTGGAATTSGGTIFAKAGTLNLNGGTIEAGTVGSGKSGTSVFAYTAATTAPCTVNIGSVNVPDADRNSFVIGGNTTVNLTGAPKIGYMSSTSAITVNELTSGTSVYLAISSSLPVTDTNGQLNTYLEKGYLKAYAAGKVLTVNGNALEPVAYDCPCCDTAPADIMWVAWNGTVTTGTHYYLAEDLVFEKQFNVTDANAITLDLHGRRITAEASRAFIVNGALDVVDSGGTGGMNCGIYGYNGGVFSVQATGDLELYGGRYTALAAPSKGSVAYVVGSMTIHEGVVLDGSAANDASMLCSTVYTKGSFAMDGGSVIGAVSGGGGSIYMESGILSLTGGTIFGGQGAIGKDVYISAATSATFGSCSIADQVQISTAETVTLTGAPRLEELKLSDSVRITLDELTENAQVKVVADGEFTVASENAAAYLADGYILSAKANMEIIERSGILVMQGLPGVKCPHCGSASVTWNVWSPSATAAGHYYLEETVTMEKEFSVSTDMVIDLRGHKVTSDARAFNVKKGTLCIVDTEGGAVVTGAQTGNGGVLYVTAGATMELMGGKYAAGTTSSKGGVAYVPAGGRLNIRQGTVIDGNAKACAPVYVGGYVYMYGGEIKGSSASLGGSVHIYDTGYFELAGGKISGGNGTSITSAYALGGDNVYVQGGRMLMSGGTIEAEDTTHLGTAILGTESAAVTITGAADPEGLSGKVLTDSTCKFAAHLGAGATNSFGRETWYATNAEALASNQVLVRLYSDAPVVLTEDTKVDLNGHKVAVSGNYQLSGIDSTATTSAAGVGEATVEGSVADSVSYDGDRFIAVNEDGKITFHRLQMRISQVSLRAKSAGIYYKSSILCDSVLEQKITRYGVAVSVNAMPDADFQAPLSKCLYTWIDTDAFESGVYTSGIVNGIMKEGNTDNAQRAQIDIYANPYIYMEGKLVMGQESDTAVWNLQKVMDGVNRIYPTLDDTQIGMVRAMYEKFTSVMSQWNLHNVQAQIDGNYEVKHLKVLTLGHSLAVDAGRMLARVAYAEGATDITVGTLYYSGCTLTQHANYLTYNTPCYNMYYSKLSTADRAPIVTQSVTMQEGIMWDDWDIIVMQAGVFEAGRPGEYDGDIQTIIDYINAHKTNPDAKLVWNMTWAAPEDEDLLNASYKSNFTTYFDKDQLKMHSAICNAVQTKILTNDAFTKVIPTGTAIQNASSSYLEDKDIYRDYIHTTDFGRLVAAYTWYCALTGRDIADIKLDVIPGFLRFHAEDQNSDLVLTDTQKAILVESVRNAIADPFAVTQSQFTTKP